MFHGFLLKHLWVCYSALNFYGTIHIRRPWELSNFQYPQPPLSIYVQNSSNPLTMDVQFQTKRPSPHPPIHHPPTPHKMITNQLQENIIQGWLLYVIRVLLSSRLSFFINLVWLSFDFFSFSWRHLSAFSWLYALVCAVVTKCLLFTINYLHSCMGII